MVEPIVWWIMIELLGLAALPLAWVVMRRLPDRGYAFAKTLGVVVVGYLMWLTSILQLARFEQGLAWVAFLVLIGLALWLALRNGRQVGTEIVSFFRARWTYWLTAEVVFTLAFAAMVLMKAYTPNIRITEQYMDFGFLNSIIKNGTMPPPDHWLAGWSINYYYLGYSLMASLTLLSGISSTIGYNLCMATLFALTALGSFGIVYNLVQGALVGRERRPSRRTAGTPSNRRVARERAQVTAALPPEDATDLTPDDVGESVSQPAPDVLVAPAGSSEEALAPARPQVPLPPRPQLAALGAGLLAVLMVAVMGNLSGAQQVLQRGLTAENFDYFSAPTRVIHEQNPVTNYVDSYGDITEFPLFSFLLNDMHPHVMALPIMLLGLALALALLKLGAVGSVGRRRWLPDVGLLARSTEGRLRLLVTALVIGLMYGLNTWDYPTYLLIVLAALAWPALAARSNPRDLPDADEDAGLWARLTSWTAGRVGWWVTQAVALVALSLALFLPFHLTFASLVGGREVDVPSGIAGIPILGALAKRIAATIGANTNDKLYNWDGYIVIFGIFLFALVAFLLLMALRSVMSALQARREGGADNGLIWLAVVAGISLVLAVIAFPLHFPLLGLLLPMALFAAVLIRERLHPERWQSEELFVLTIIGVGALLTLVTEVFFIQDVFGRRMNTVFKFYYQTWVLWGLAAAFATWWLVGLPFVRQAQARLAEGLNRGQSTPRTVADTLGLVTAPLWGLAVLALVGLGLVYTAYAPQAKIRSDYGPPPVGGWPLRGLDGTAYLRNEAPADLAAIQWLRDSATPGVITEAPGGEYNVYCYCGRVSALSGLPTIVAWTGHEDQWRGGQPAARNEIQPRVADMDKIYASTDLTETRQLMTKYNVRYVFVGTIEKGETTFGDNQRHQYGAGLNKFAQFMTPVYTQNGTTIYMLPEAGLANPRRVIAGGP